MYQKLKKRHDDIDLNDLNNLLLIISLISLNIFLINKNNFLILLLILVFIYEISSHLMDNKYIRFLSNFIVIIHFAYLLMRSLNLKILFFNMIEPFQIFIKFGIFITYSLIVFICIKRKKLKIIKGEKRKIKKYKFKEIIAKKIDEFKNNNLKMIDNYIKEEKITKSSDYYKVIENNLNDKSKNDLEEYVWVNYLRFYKNRRYNKRNVFDKLNFIFITIHVIILLLAIFVRF